VSTVGHRRAMSLYNLFRPQAVEDVYGTSRKPIAQTTLPVATSTTWIPTLAERHNAQCARIFLNLHLKYPPPENHWRYIDTKIFPANEVFRQNMMQYLIRANQDATQQEKLRAIVARGDRREIDDLLQDWEDRNSN
jgi:hypothetical protein